ncbi:hypothetical protein Thiowin_01364 [Thiorhodovibrio winogradskyi]|uniref:Tox-PAAR-like domain-containing protein n=1 Tax=Thiorhodovibrio winogradskyi TaxID=77007 RepID=A0ABZ0S7C7_9GAMM|nr:DUF4150 domain-containing protein [Thiorhodovibrio winogradskyi]
MFACCKSSGMAFAFPDVCKVPTPGGPVPTPLPNTAQMALALPGANKVLITGAPAVNKKCKISLSEGDEPGVAMGVQSNTIKGPAKFTNGSAKVRIEGSPAQRMGDPTSQNKDNAQLGNVLAPSQTKVMIMS